jgi:serine/threonine-protein kinase
MLGGKYRIRRVLGQGGMGVVVEALHVELEDRVAIKFLTPRALTEPDAVQRFVREAKAAVRLRSEHIARVRDVGLLPGGDPYIVMEFLDGVELRELLSGPRMAPDALVDLVLQACEGLAEAHAIGIVHRDIKPSNLFVTRHSDGTPHVKVLDFGVSKVPLDDVHLTGTNSWMGTPAYMSPEQMRSTKSADPRSDIWSLAVVLYEGLEGRLPFPGESLAELCVSVTSQDPEPLTDRTPPGLAAVVMRCFEKEPDRRYDNVAELAAALAPFAGSRNHAELIVQRTRRMYPDPSTERPTAQITPARAAFASAATVLTADGVVPDDSIDLPPRSRGPAIAVASTVAIALGLLVFLLVRSTAAHDTVPPDAAVQASVTPDATRVEVADASVATVVVDATVPDAAVVVRARPDARPARPARDTAAIAPAAPIAVDAGVETAPPPPDAWKDPMGRRI